MDKLASEASYSNVVGGGFMSLYTSMGSHGAN